MPASVRTLWDEIGVAFEGVDLILHAGDIVLPSVLDQLEEIAPVLAARGNNDPGWDDHRLADTQWLDLEGFRIAMVHDMEPEDEPIDVLASQVSRRRARRRDDHRSYALRTARRGATARCR